MQPDVPTILFHPPVQTIPKAIAVVAHAWPTIIEECRAVLGGELHYQAIIYHCLRHAGVPRNQLGMNVKQWIAGPITPLFQDLDSKKHVD